MKDAKDAVKEIKEWPVQKYLIENEDGSIEFSDNKPGRVVCTREEFFNALKERQMKTLTEAVKACGGVWPSDSLEGVGVGWNGKSTDREPDFIQLGIGGPEFTRPEFEAEARRQGYVEGFEGHPDDVAFKGDWLPPIGTLCEVVEDDSLMYGHGEKGEVIAHVEKTAVIRMSYGLGCFTVQNLRPIKLDRALWKELARAIWNDGIRKGRDGDPFGNIYDALISGQLPMPEGK